MKRFMALTAAAVLVTSPVQAEWRGNYHDGYGEHHRGIGPGAAIGLGVLGALAGAAILTTPRVTYPPPVYYPPPPVYYAPPPVYYPPPGTYPPGYYPPGYYPR